MFSRLYGLQRRPQRGVSDCYAYAHPNPDAHANPNAHANPDANAYAIPNFNSNGHAQPDADA